jgi:PAS domain S-box-containing protein
MQFSPESSRMGLFIAEAMTTGAMPIFVWATYSNSNGSKIGKYTLPYHILLYFFFMIFHFKGYYVNLEIINGILVITPGSGVIYSLYAIYNIISPVICVAIMLETAIRIGFKHEWLITLILAPIYLFGSYLLYLRFVEPESRLFGCFVQTTALALLFFFTKQYNIRVISNTQAANVVFSTVQTPYIFVTIQGEIFYANASALQFFGLYLEEIQGKRLEDLFQFDGEKPENFKRHRRDANEMDDYRAVSLSTNAHCHLTVSYQYDSFSELLCVIIEVEDVTERERLFTQLEEARRRAEDAAAAKSNFLAKTSHEIRTPMNAILGMAELLLHKDIPPDAYEDAINIRQAGSNLLSIINDILDFSKIESGKLDIATAEYSFASLIQDVINIIRMRLSEKPIDFLANIDSKLPSLLEGDESRIRQILLNLLSNAVKYTMEGQIVFDVYGERQGDMIQLTIEVSDTGIGIKEDDLGKLFGEFVQFDSHRNQEIEGTGLGLAISRNLCRLMGGDIWAQSTYGQGSVFTAVLPQKVKNDTPFAQVEKPEQKTVLLYEARESYAVSVYRSLENLSVPVRRAVEPEELYRALEEGYAPGQPFAFVFVSAKAAGDMLDLIKSRGLRTVPVMLLEAGEITSFQNTRFLSMPAYALALANMLNGKLGLGLEYREKARAAFTAPDATILIVDDIMTNLNVARGLLALYQMDIHVCTGGADAVELVKKHSYDIIFMDHMMPGMDGIEATAIIRAMGGVYREVPVIALTANAVSGMREMFLDNGFNDYLAKPIEIAKLNEIIEKWIPVDKQRRKTVAAIGTAPASPFHIDGMDVAKGIAMTGGTMQGYREVLGVFYQDILERLPLLKDMPPEQELPLYITQVHALKSASASLGAMELSQEAAGLEAAGRAGDLATLEAGISRFYADLEKLAERIRAALEGE